MNTWKKDVIKAFRNLGGEASYKSLFKEIEKIRHGPFSPEWKKTVRTIVTKNSSDSNYFREEDIFYTVEGLRKGVWGLRELKETPKQTKRTKFQDSRIIRDTDLIRKIKRIHKNKCQICGYTLKLNDERTYSEAHHIIPLGEPHNGEDVDKNIIILCPNHHVCCDYGAIKLDLKKLRLHPSHDVGEKFIKYHNKEIFGKV